MSILDLMGDVLKDAPWVTELIRDNEKEVARPKKRKVKPQAFAVDYQSNPPNGFPASGWSVGGLQLASPVESEQPKKKKRRVYFRYPLGLNHSVRNEFGGFEQVIFFADALKEVESPLKEINEALAEEVKAKLFLEDGDVHWITTQDGRHIPIGGDSGGGIRPTFGSASPASSVHAQVNAQNVKKLADTLSDTHGKLPINPDKIENNELKTFVKGIDGFTDGAYKALTTATEKINTGDAEAAKKIAGSEEAFRQAQIINEAVKSAEPKQVHVWRGLGTAQRVQEIEALKSGDTVSIAGVKSFSHYRSVSVQYAKKNGQYNYFFEVRGEAKGVSIAGLSRAPSEHEFITQGKFAVDAVRTVSSTTKVISVHQVGVY